MAEEAKQDDDDLSIEEILSSIRDIISDEDEEAAEEAPAADAEEKEEAPEEKVLEQEDKEEPKEEVVQAEPEAKPEENVKAAAEETPAEEEEVLELGDPIEETAEEAPAEEEEETVPEIELRDMDEKEEETVESVESVSKPVEDSVREELISATTASASLEAMSKLVADEAARPDNSSTIEQITKDLLRPMLKDWLDANLPALIEKLVQKELRRLSLKSLDE